jgi:small-conductance mechanosensitive channel
VALAAPPASDAGLSASTPLDARADLADGAASLDAGHEAAATEIPAATVEARPPAPPPPAPPSTDGEAPREASAAPLASTAASAERPPSAQIAYVRLRDKKLFAVRTGRAGLTAEERARKASTALDAAFEKNLGGEVTVDETEPGVAAIVLDGTPIVQLTLDDALAASDTSLALHAASVAETVRTGVRAERTRHDVATTVFHWSLVVLTGLVGFLVQRRLRRLLRVGRIWLRRHPERVRAFRIGRIDLVRPTALLGLLQLSAAALDRAVQATVFSVWVVFSLSLFERTKQASSTLTGFVVLPLKAFASRVATSLPSLVAVVLALVATFVVVRFVSHVERSVERGEAELPGLSKDLTRPVLVLVRLSVVLFSLLVGAPVVLGSDDSVLSRLGLALVASLSLASAPVLASAVLGVVALFAGKYHPGEYVSFDGRQGRVVHVGLLDLRLRDGEGAEVRIPHLVAAVRDVRVLGPYRLATFELVVDPAADLEMVRSVVATAAESRHGAPRVRLLGVHARGARFEVVARRGDDENDAATACAKALRDAGIALGHVA